MSFALRVMTLNSLFYVLSRSMILLHLKMGESQSIEGIAVIRLYLQNMSKPSDSILYHPYLLIAACNVVQ